MRDYEKDKARLRGALTPQLTVTKRNREVDIEATQRLTRFMVDHNHVEGNGVIVPCSGIGSFHLLSTEERKAVSEAVVAAARGRVPVYVGADSTSTLTTLELAKHAEDVGADGLQVRQPFFVSPTDDMIYEHYRLLAKATDLPLLVYNSPGSCGGKDISPKVLAKLARVPSVVGLKWSAANALLYPQVIGEFQGRFVMIDDEYVYTGGGGMVMGCRGFIDMSSNFFPEYSQKIWHLYERGRFAEAWKEVTKLELRLYLLDQEIGGNLVGLIGAAVDLVGLDGGTPRPPHLPLDQSQKDKLRKILERAGAKTVR